MWIHNVSWLSSWYTAIGLIVLGFLLSIIGYLNLHYSKFRPLADEVLIASAVITSIIAGIVVVIVDINHPVELGVFYVYFIAAVVFPGILFILGILARVIGFSNDLHTVSNVGSGRTKLTS